jgi:hypothetical protein
LKGDLVNLQEGNNLKFSKKAKSLIVEASRDENRTIIKQTIATGGFALWTNGMNLVEKNIPRQQALWENVLQYLLENNLLELVEKDIFKLTDKGFQIAEILINK